jgi:GNAT superfamily N-acetyltransferase
VKIANARYRRAEEMETNETEPVPSALAPCEVPVGSLEGGPPLRAIIEPPQPPDSLWSAQLMNGEAAPIFEAVGWICAYPPELEATLAARSHLRVLETSCDRRYVGRGYGTRLLEAVERYFELRVEPSATHVYVDQSLHWEWLEQHQGALRPENLLE